MADYSSSEDQLISQSANQLADYLGRKRLQQQAEAAKVQEAMRQKAEFEQMSADPRFKDLPITVGEYHLGGKPSDPSQGLKDFFLKQQFEQAQKEAEQRKRAQIPGFQLKDQSYIPSEEDVRSVKKQAETTAQIGASTKKLQEAAKGAGMMDKLSLFGLKSGKKADMDQAISDLTLKLKNAEQLGAISGADLDLVSKRIGRISGIGSLFKSDAEIQNEIAKIYDDYKNQLAAGAEARGYAMQPQAGQNIMPASAPKMSNEDSQAIEWAKKNPQDKRAQQILQMHGVK